MGERRLRKSEAEGSNPFISIEFASTSVDKKEFFDPFSHLFHLRLSATSADDMTTMKNPPHPGETVRYDCLEPLGLTVTEGAKALGVTRQALNNLVNGKSGISPEMAIRLSKAFGSSPETWLKMQLDYDLAQVRRRGDIQVKRVQRPHDQPHL